MRKESILILGLLAIVLSTTAVIWSFALPVLKPIDIPLIASATLQEGPERASQELSTAQIHALNTWLKDNRRGWVPMTHEPPAYGDRWVQAIPVEGVRFELRIWGNSAGDAWSRSIAVRPSPKVSYRVRYCDAQQWAALDSIFNKPAAATSEGR